MLSEKHVDITYLHKIFIYNHITWGYKKLFKKKNKLFGQLTKFDGFDFFPHEFDVNEVAYVGQKSSSFASSLSHIHTQKWKYVDIYHPNNNNKFYFFFRLWSWKWYIIRVMNFLCQTFSFASFIYPVYIERKTHY